MLSPGSRYHGLEDTLMVDGQTIAYLRRRLLPRPDTLTAISVHVVGQAERLDRTAAQELGDPELFWRIADANLASDLSALVEPGRRLRITLPDNLGGSGG